MVKIGNGAGHPISWVTAGDMSNTILDPIKKQYLEQVQARSGMGHSSTDDIIPVVPLFPELLCCGRVVDMKPNQYPDTDSHMGICPVCQREWFLQVTGFKIDETLEEMLQQANLQGTFRVETEITRRSVNVFHDLLSAINDAIQVSRFGDTHVRIVNEHGQILWEKSEDENENNA
jgi:hypothetical protein